MNVELYIQEIKNRLKKEGFSGKKVSYTDIQNLHRIYGNGTLSEQEFALYVLELSMNSYNSVKTGKYNTTILQEQLDQIIKEETEDIKKQLILQGYAGKLIDYERLQELHQKHGKQMPENVFAKYVLELSKSSYDALRGGRRKNVYILRNLKKESSADLEEIKRKIRADGYVGKKIDYIELKILHNKYGPQYSESRFAQRVLEIGETSYLSMKNNGTRARRILKSFIGNTSDEEIHAIKCKLIEDGCVGESIDYIKLKILHQEYAKQMTEREFAERVLEIGESYYYNIKSNPKKRAIIPRSLLQESIPKQTISTNIIKQKKIKELKEQLKERGYVGKSIDYTELNLLYNQYGYPIFNEREFACSVLEINPSHFKLLKRGLRNAHIIKSLEAKISKEEIDIIKQKLEMLGYRMKMVNYEQIQELYKMYGKKMSESKFVEEVLGISAAFLGNLKKSPKAKAKILKDLSFPISYEEIEVIKETLEAKGYGGMSIGYEEFLKLYQIFGEKVSEEEFASVILEIPYKSYFKKMKEGKNRTKILCNNSKMQLIRSLQFKVSRWYQREEIEKICSDNQVPIDKLIRQIASNGTILYNEYYKKVLEEKGQLWIGKTRLSNEFIENNYPKIMNMAKIALKTVKRRFGINENMEDEDMIQDAIIWLMENAGEAEKNFLEYPNIIEQRIFNTLRKSILIKFMHIINVRIRTISSNQRLVPRKHKDSTKEGDELGTRFAGTYNTEEEAIKRMENKNAKYEIENETKEEELAIRCIQYMKIQIENGLSRQEILDGAIKEFDLSQKELLELMQNYLVTKGKVSIDNGRATWR